MCKLIICYRYRNPSQEVSVPVMTSVAGLLPVWWLTRVCLNQDTPVLTVSDSTTTVSGVNHCVVIKAMNQKKENLFSY